MWMNSKLRPASRALFLVAGLLAPVTGWTQTADQIASIKKSTIFIQVTRKSGSDQTTTQTGSGFVITKTGFAITAAHVVAGDNVAKIEFSIGSRYNTLTTAWVLASGPEVSDAVLLQLPPGVGLYFPVSFADPHKSQPGDKLAAVGFAFGDDYAPAFGNLTSQGQGARAGLWGVSVLVNPGNSGGPILNENGRVIGMVKGGQPSAPGINFMTPLHFLSPLFGIAGLRWPPFEGGDVVAPSPGEGLSIVESGRVPQNQRCHEITVVTGLPPVYAKRLECDP